MYEYIKTKTKAKTKQLNHLDNNKNSTDTIIATVMRRERMYIYIHNEYNYYFGKEGNGILKFDLEKEFRSRTCQRYCKQHYQLKCI
jgi:hypothetical protein